jgi:UDP-N-acetylglucosamine transferase subunit ALG13
MRSVVTKGGFPTFVSSEEFEFIESITENAYKSKMDERQAELAKVLTSRGVLSRYNDTDNGIYYTRNQNQGV